MLTNNDLQAIKGIVDEAFEGSDQRTAAGFAEVHAKINETDNRISKKIDEIDNKLSVKDGKLENTVERVDKHVTQIAKINKKLSIA